MSLQLPQDIQGASGVSQRLFGGLQGQPVAGRVICWTHETAGVPGDEGFQCAGCAAAREIAVSRARTRFLQIVADGEKR